MIMYLYIYILYDWLYVYPCLIPPQVPPDGDRDVVTITFGTGEISGVFVKDSERFFWSRPGMNLEQTEGQKTIRNDDTLCRMGPPR